MLCVHVPDVRSPPPPPLLCPRAGAVHAQQRRVARLPLPAAAPDDGQPRGRGQPGQDGGQAGGWDGWRGAQAGTCCMWDGSAAQLAALPPPCCSIPPPCPSHRLRPLCPRPRPAQPGPPLDLNTMADLFLQRNMVREATAFLLDVLQDNDPKHAVLQTKLLEINLVTNPQARRGRGWGMGGRGSGRRPTCNPDAIPHLHPPLPTHLPHPTRPPPRRWRTRSWPTARSRTTTARAWRSCARRLGCTCARCSTTPTCPTSSAWWSTPTPSSRRPWWSTLARCRVRWGHGAGRACGAAPQRGRREERGGRPASWLPRPPMLPLAAPPCPSPLPPSPSLCCSRVGAGVPQGAAGDQHAAEPADRGQRGQGVHGAGGCMPCRAGCAERPRARSCRLGGSARQRQSHHTPAGRTTRMPTHSHATHPPAQLTAEKIIELLEAHKSYHGLYFYLGAHLAFSENPEVRGFGV